MITNKTKAFILAWTIATTAIFSNNASAKSEKIVFAEYPRIVACYDYSKGTFHEPKNGSCIIGRTMKNVYLPSKSQMVLFKEVYKERSAMYVPLALVNWESQFDEKAHSCNQYACASGIMQVTDANGGKRMTTKQQLQWFADRKQHQITVGTCSKTAKSWNHDKLKRCVFARHFGTLDFYGQYVNEKMDMYDFYKKLLEGKELVF